MKTPAEYEAYIIGLERCIAKQTERETDLRWQLAQMIGQLKESEHQAARYCHHAMKLEQQLAAMPTVEITVVDTPLRYPVIDWSAQDAGDRHG